MSGTRAAVIGCGDISALHLDAIASAPDVTLVAVCDTDAGRLDAAAVANGVPGFAEYRRLFEELQPDVVHVCTPHNTHAEIAVAALERNIHVILEKPLAHTRSEADRLLSAAEASDARIAVCFQNRYNAPVQAAKAALSGGRLGAVSGASATVLWHRTAEYYLNRPWRGSWAGGGGGLLMNQAIHTVDLLQWLLGPVASVSGSVSTRFLDEVIEVEDTAEMVIRHENGARSVFYATLANAVNAPVEISILTEHATLRLSGDLTIEHADGTIERVSEPEAAQGERAYWGVSHRLLIHDFYAGLDDRGAFWIDPAAARASFDVIQDVYDQSFPERAGFALPAHHDSFETIDTTERKPLQ